MGHREHDLPNTSNETSRLEESKVLTTSLETTSENKCCSGNGNSSTTTNPVTKVTCEKRAAESSRSEQRYYKTSAGIDMLVYHSQGL